MNCNVLSQKRQYRREFLPQVPSSTKYLAAALAACFMAFPPSVDAQTTGGGTISVPINNLREIASGEWSTETGPWIDDTSGTHRTVTNFTSVDASAVGIWIRGGGSFVDNAEITRIAAPTLFQLGGNSQYPTDYPNDWNRAFIIDPHNSHGGKISVHGLYTPNSSGATAPSLTIAVLGSSENDSVFSAERINSWAGLSGTPDDTGKPEYLKIYVDGAKTPHRTAIDVTNSAELSAEKGVSFTVQNSGLFQVGKELSIRMRNSIDRFIVSDNLGTNTGIVVKGSDDDTGDNGTDFSLYNSVKPLLDSNNNVVTSHESSYALIKNSNVEVQNGSFVLWGGEYVGIYKDVLNKKGEWEAEKVGEELVSKPEYTFLQIVNDDQSKAEFRANSVQVHSLAPGNTTILLLGHGANVVAEDISLFSRHEDSTAVLMLGDTSSEDDNYSPSVQKIFFGYEYGSEQEKGKKIIIFNNKHSGDSAEKATFEIQGEGTVHVQTGRTILTKDSPGFSGQTLIDPNTSLILTVDPSSKSPGDESRTTLGAGSSKINIRHDGELIYRGVRDTFHNEIEGPGKIILENSQMRLTNDSPWMTDDANWTGTIELSTTDAKNPTFLILGKDRHPVNFSSSNVIVSKDSTLKGLGSIAGSLDNHGTFWIGDDDKQTLFRSKTEGFDFNIGGDVTNHAPGTIQLGNGKVAGAPSGSDGKYSGNTLTVHKSYTGNNGLIVFNTVLNGDNDSPTDKLVVNGDTNGSTRVKVNKLGGSGERTINGIELIRVEGNSSGTFVKDGRIVAGAYEYNLERGTGANDKNWYLKSHLKGPRHLLKPLYRPEVGAYVGNSAVVQTLFSSRLHDRIGDLWYADPYAVNNQLTGVWMKQRGNYNTWRESSGQTRNRTQMYSTQIGADVASWTSNGENRFLVGWVAGYGHGRTKSHSIHSGYRAIGTVDGLNVGITGTWYQDGLHHQGMYVDTWLTYGWFDNKVKGENLETEKYHSRGFTGSLETGYTWKLGEHVTEKGCDIGWFLQPQAQMIWSGVKTDTIHEHNGTAVKSKGRNNIQTRLGARLLMDTNLRSYANGIGGTQFFIEGNWVHNTKSHGVDMNGTVLNQEGARHLGEVKFGINGNPTDSLHVWTNVTVRAGTHHYRDLTGMIGLKYSF